MTGSHESEPSTVLVSREAYSELLRASRRNVQLAWAAGGIALWAAVVLGAVEAAVTLWVGLFAIAGVAFVAWAIVTSRRLTRRYGPPGVPPTGAPFSPVPYVDRQASMWHEGGAGVGGDPGSNLPGS